MRRVLPGFAVALLALLASACSSTGSPNNPADAGAGDSAADAGADASTAACAGPCPASKIKYLVVIVQENHTFDNHFGQYCTAAAGSNPTCNDGPACCEAGPAKDPSGASPTVITDTEHAGWDPSHASSCETAEINGGKMDKFVAGATGCSDPRNFGYADQALVKPYWDLAKQGAIGDRYFQPLIGQSAANNMYFARAAWVFDDNSVSPKGAIGQSCGFIPRTAEFTDKTIGDLLVGKAVPWTFYAEGYKAMSDAQAGGNCPAASVGCPSQLTTYPCAYDPSDDPFTYFPSSRDKAPLIRDLGAFSLDLAAKALPAVSFVKAIGWRSEHPGTQDKLSDGVKFATDTIAQIMSSPYANDVLILVTWDEGGGYFDHVAPPANNPADGKPYGTRVPLIAVGPFAKKNFVSHVTMEHSSIVKFIEWNWLGKQTGQLATRDANVNNIGSLLDAAKTGEAVPE